MTMHMAFHPQANVDRLYILRIIVEGEWSMLEIV